MFVRVVETGSFAAVARETGLSATMVANHVKALEDHLGGRLLSRTTRSQSLTELGHSYFTDCREVLRLVERAEAGVRAMQGEPRGKLRLTAPVSFGTVVLMPALASYAALYPRVELDVALTDRVVDMVEEGFEAAFRIGRLPDSGLVARPLAPYRMVVCASPAYVARKGRPQTPDDLGDHDCLALSQPGASGWRIGGRKISIHPRLRVDGGPALLAATSAGLGIAMLPEALAAAALADGRLVRLFEGHQMPSRPMHLVYVADSRMSPKVRSFVDHALSVFADR